LDVRFRQVVFFESKHSELHEVVELLLNKFAMKTFGIARRQNAMASKLVLVLALVDQIKSWKVVRALVVRAKEEVKTKTNGELQCYRIHHCEGPPN
jgi:hypothetical protein